MIPRRHSLIIAIAFIVLAVIVYSMIGCATTNCAEKSFIACEHQGTHVCVGTTPTGGRHALAYYMKDGKRVWLEVLGDTIYEYDTPECHLTNTQEFTADGFRDYMRQFKRVQVAADRRES